jgi:hypothetical protein
LIPAKRVLKALAKPGIALFYLLILLEGVYMTSFFATYLFSTYVPIQTLAEKSPAFSWLTDFYLSHFIDWTGGGESRGCGKIGRTAF